MMLKEQIELFDNDDIVWWYQGESFSKNYITDFLISSSEYEYLVHKKKVALFLNNPLNVALSLCFLDGIADSILFLPLEQDHQELASYLSDSECSTVISDNLSIENMLPDNVELLPIDRLKSRSGYIKEYQFELEKLIETKWIIPTSGTTGTPKLVSHTLQSLTRTVRTDRVKGKNYTWGLLYGVVRFAGLQVFLQCLYSGSPLVLLKGNESTEDAILQLVNSNCNSLSATPTMWRKILMHDRHIDMKLKQITLGGEAVDQRVLNALSKSFTNARLTHIYASTEAGVGFAVTDGIEGFPKDFLCSSPCNVSIKVDCDGFLLLKPKNSAQKYIGSDEKLKQDDGFINTGDLVKLLNDRYIFLGRANGAINVGGNKVQPEEIEQVIRSFPDVRLVSVYSKSSSIMGGLVAADIVVSNEVHDEGLLKKQLKAYCREKLDSYKVPAIIRVVSDIKVNHTGKILRS